MSDIDRGGEEVLKGERILHIFTCEEQASEFARRAEQFGWLIPVEVSPFKLRRCGRYLFCTNEVVSAQILHCLLAVALGYADVCLEEIWQEAAKDG